MASHRYRLFTKGFMHEASRINPGVPSRRMLVHNAEAWKGQAAVVASCPNCGEVHLMHKDCLDQARTNPSSNTGVSEWLPWVAIGGAALLFGPRLISSLQGLTSSVSGNVTAATGVTAGTAAPAGPAISQAAARDIQGLGAGYSPSYKFGQAEVQASGGYANFSARYGKAATDAYLLGGPHP